MIFSNKLFLVISTGVGLVAWVIWSINLIKLVRWQKVVGASTIYKEALNDELHQHTVLKSFRNAYVITIIVITCFYFLLKSQPPVRSV